VALVSGALAVAVALLTTNVGYWFHCLALAVPFWLFFRALSRRLEHDADRYAARATSESAMSNALVDLTELNLFPRSVGRTNELLSTYSSVSRRLDRIRPGSTGTGND
jgi:Zn-dependent protease with chaperone function